MIILPSTGLFWTELMLLFIYLQEQDQTGWRRSRGTSSSAPSTGTSVFCSRTHRNTHTHRNKTHIFTFLLWANLLYVVLTFFFFLCRNCSAERSSLLSNRLQDDLTTLSILIQSSRLKHPGVQAVTLPHLSSCFVFTRCYTASDIWAPNINSCSCVCVCQILRGSLQVPTHISYSEDSVLWP